jgi:hypothetical protein
LYVFNGWGRKGENKMENFNDEFEKLENFQEVCKRITESVMHEIAEEERKKEHKKHRLEQIKNLKELRKKQKTILKSFSKLFHLSSTKNIFI